MTTIPCVGLRATAPYGSEPATPADAAPRPATFPEQVQTHAARSGTDDDPARLQEDLRTARSLLIRSTDKNTDRVATCLAQLRGLVEAWRALSSSRQIRAAGSPGDEARWAELIAGADPAEEVPATLDGLRNQAQAVMALLKALQQTAPPVPPARVVADRIAAHLGERYAPGLSLGRKALAADLDVPEDLVRLALSDLVTSGALTSANHRVLVPQTGEERPGRVRHLADRILAQIAFGLYPPRSPLPGAAALAALHATDADLATDALRLLETEGWLHRVRGRPAMVLPSALLLAPRDPASTIPVHPGGPFTEAEIRRALQEAHNSWKRRAFVPPQRVEERWVVLQAMAAQCFPDRVPARLTTPRRRRAALLVREAASAPLPDTSLLGMWHTAGLVNVIRLLLRTYPARGLADRPGRALPVQSLPAYSGSTVKPSQSPS